MQRLKILTTCYDYRPNLGGIATFTHELSRAMAKQPGVDLRLIAPASESGAEIDRRDGLSVRRVQLPRHGLQAMLPMTMALGSELRSFKPDAVLNTLWMPDGAGSLALSPLRSVPYFLCAYGMEFLESSANWKKRVRAGLSPLKRQVFSKARGVFAISEFTRELAISVAAADASKTSLVYCGVDPEEFRPEAPSEGLRRELGLQGKKVFFTVSRLDDYKGMDFAIASLKSVVAKHPDVVYLICGEGPDRARLEQLVSDHQMQKHVIFGGRVPQGRLRDYYNLADAFVLLSRNDWKAPNVEGFGIVFLEAAACEKPVIAGASGGIPDAVADGVTGWLVDPTDEGAIARAMLECLDHPEEALQRGRAGRARVQDKFTWGDVARRVLDGMRNGLNVRD